MEYNNKPYGNYKMISIDGEFLCHTDFKRMNWYVKRNLAKMVDEFTYQLTFISKGNNSNRGEFYKIPLKNQCVVCGTKDELTKHHIVPSQFRKLLPLKYKGRNSFDVVIICNSCHNDYEREADVVKNNMLLHYGLINYDKDTIKIKRYYNRLKYYRDKIPKEKEENMIKFLTNKLECKIDDILALNKIDRPTVSEKIMEHITNYEWFIIGWRKHFINKTKPKYISKEWVDEIEINFPE